MPQLLTAGEECSIAAKVFNFFSDKAIPASYLASSLGVTIAKGANGTAVVRLSSGEWSAPCAFALYSEQMEIDPNQETVILFMSERSIIGLIKNETVILNRTHSFLPGPFNENAPLENTDMYVYVRFNSQFTPGNLIMQGMTGWQIGEDKTRHNKWHGNGVTWFDVLTNKITVDRSSVGNALYLVLNLLAGRSKIKPTTKNFVEPSKMVGPRPSDVADSSGQRNLSDSIGSNSTQRSNMPMQSQRMVQQAPQFMGAQQPAYNQSQYQGNQWQSQAPQMTAHQMPLQNQQVLAGFQYPQQMYNQNPQSQLNQQQMLPQSLLTQNNHASNYQQAGSAQFDQQSRNDQQQNYMRESQGHIQQPNSGDQTQCQHHLQGQQHLDMIRQHHQNTISQPSYPGDRNLNQQSYPQAPTPYTQPQQGMQNGYQTPYGYQ